MSKEAKVLLGILSFLPIVFFITFFILMFNLFPTIIEWSRYEPDIYAVFETFKPFFILGLCWAIVSITLLVFFIIHLANNRNIQTGEKLLWILVFFLFGIIGYPTYWYMRIWRDDLKKDPI